MPRAARFTPELFRFLRELAANNRRDWFHANKERYEAHVRGPMLRFIADFAPSLRKISRSFVADASPVGGSLFRIHRCLSEKAACAPDFLSRFAEASRLGTPLVRFLTEGLELPF